MFSRFCSMWEKYKRKGVDHYPWPKKKEKNTRISWNCEELTKEASKLPSLINKWGGRFLLMQDDLQESFCTVWGVHDRTQGREQRSMDYGDTLERATEKKNNNSVGKWTTRRESTWMCIPEPKCFKGFKDVKGYREFSMANGENHISRRLGSKRKPRSTQVPRTLYTISYASS